MGKTTIQITTETKEKLLDLASTTETYDNTINKLLSNDKIIVEKKAIEKIVKNGDNDGYVVLPESWFSRNVLIVLFDDIPNYDGDLRIFKRVTSMGDGCCAYLNKKWIGKKVLVYLL